MSLAPLTCLNSSSFSLLSSFFSFFPAISSAELVFSISDNHCFFCFPDKEEELNPRGKPASSSNSGFSKLGDCGRFDFILKGPQQKLLLVWSLLSRGALPIHGDAFHIFLPARNSSSLAAICSVGSGCGYLHMGLKV